MLDRDKFAEVLDGVRRLRPARIFLSHLPAADGACLDLFLDLLARTPDATPIEAPSHAEFAGMLDMMQAEMERAAALA